MHLIEKYVGGNFFVENVIFFFNLETENILPGMYFQQNIESETYNHGTY